MSLIYLDKDLIEQASKYGKATNKNTLEQLEEWIRIGKVCQDNPDLTYQDIKEILCGLAEVKNSMTTPYKIF